MLLVGVVVLGVLAGVVFGLLRSPGSSSVDVRVVGLDGLLDAGDALVVVDGIRLGRVVTLHEAEYQIATVHVVEVRYEADIANQDLDLADPSPPPVEPGDLQIYEPLGSRASRRGASAISHLTELSGARSVLLLGYWAPEVYSDWPAPWGVVVAADVGSDETLTFVGDHPARYAADLNAAVAGLDGQVTELEALTRWLAEKDATRAGQPPGPMTVAYRAYAASRVPTPEQRWRDADPGVRPLDPELTPPDVFATLSETPVMIIVEGDVERAAGYLAILTDLGVAHIADLTGGSHPAPVFTDPQDTWRIVLTGDPARLTDGRVVATLDSSARPNAGGVVITVTVGNTLASDTVTVSPVGAGEFDAVVQSWLDQVANAGTTP